MNYERIYQALILRARGRPKILGYETHHVIPRCLFGSDDAENLVNLTPEEHYIAHQLLVKLHPDNFAIAKAAAMMIPGRPSNKLYGWLRRRLAEAQSISQRGEGNSQFGTRWVHNPITKKNKKIKGEPENGWLFGKYKSPRIDKMALLKARREENKKKQIEIHREYYKIYKEVGFTKFVEITKYNKSKANLVQRFAVLLEEFVPQNGKKRE